MKRQKTLFEYVRKITRTESSEQEASEDETQPNLLHDANKNSVSDDMKTRNEANEAPALAGEWNSMII